MSLESAFQRLSLRPSSLCRQCRRTMASTAQQRPQQFSATASFMDSLDKSREQNERPLTSRTTTATATTDKPFPPPTKPRAERSPGFDLARSMILQSTSRSRDHRNRQALLDLQREYTRKDLEQQMVRRWKVGDVYAPHDLSGVEMSKWKKVRKRSKPRFDVLDRLGINPIDHYKNFSIMSEYITEMGRIKHNNDTSLRPVNQRKMAKAIRRAQGTGLLMPGVHRHPMLLQLEQNASRRRY